MKKFITYTLAAGLLLSSCGTANQTRSALTGAAIGSNLGNSIGGLVGESRHGWHGGFRGSAIGSIVGTLAGAAIGSAISSSQKSRENKSQEQYNSYNQDYSYGNNTSSSSGLDGLRIHNIRFVDANKDHAISSEENCQIIFEIMNEGSETAYNAVPTVQTSNSKITVSPSVLIEQIAAQNGIKYTAYLRGGSRMKDGQVTIRLSIADDMGTEYTSQEFTLSTKR